MSTCTPIFKAFPYGKDFSIAFSTKRGCEELDFDDITEITVTIYKNKLQDIKILEFGDGDFSERFDVSPVQESVEVSVPWADVLAWEASNEDELSARGTIQSVLTIQTTDRTYTIGPKMGVIGSNRFKLSSSPYKSSHDQWPVDVMTQDVETVFEAQLVDVDGSCIDLTDMSVVYVINDHYTTPARANITASILDAEAGVVQVSVPKIVLGLPGLYLAAFVVINQDDEMVFHMPRYLQIEANTNSASVNVPLSITEVRLAIRDWPVDNNLLDTVEFTDSEIAWALRRPVDIWNATPPFIHEFSPATFPWRGPWLDGTIGELCNIAMHHYARNQLPYSAGGLTVDDKNKYGVYAKMGEQSHAKFKEFVLRKKTEMNVMGGFVLNNGAYQGIGYRRRS